MTIFLVSVLCIALVAGWYLIPYGLRRISSARLRRYCWEQKAIVLSYDDGPSVHLIQRLLDLLAEQEIKATFFLLGRNVETHREAIPLLLENGHEVGSHTFDHSNAWKVWPWRATRDLARGLKCLLERGAPTRAFRPPYGKATLATLVDCWMRGLQLGWWTIDSQDVWDRRPISDVIGEIETHGGGVVLMHDLDILGVPADGLSHSDYVLNLTRGIIECAAKNGLRIRRLDDVYADAARVSV